MQPIDEAVLIEERRKRREAIKAKHRGQATPLLVQALVHDDTSTPTQQIQEIGIDRSRDLGIAVPSDLHLRDR